MIASLNAFVFDYATRQKVGGTHLTYSFLKQLPFLTPSTVSAACTWERSGAVYTWLRSRVLELAYTAWDLQRFASDLKWMEPPFRWDAARRFLLRCELDAACFHLYGIGRDDVDYIMDTFHIVRRDDQSAHGEYRTKRVILDIYDCMQRAIETGEQYQTMLDPCRSKVLPPKEEGRDSCIRFFDPRSWLGTETQDCDATQDEDPVWGRVWTLQRQDSRRSTDAGASSTGITSDRRNPGTP
jgi:hypothetical protein